ncbi:MAG: hypothetical protein D6784_13850, partial [Chloroflexi bacterium]
APELCTFIVPATVHRGAVKIAISTGGASPALARHLRRQVEQIIGPEYAVLADILAGLRPRLRAGLPDSSTRAQVIRSLLASDLLAVITAEGPEAGRAYARALLDNLIQRHGG